MIVESKRANGKLWNATLVKAEPKGTIFQSTHWAEYLRRTYGDRPIYLTSLDQKGNIQGQLLAIESCYAKHTARTLLGNRSLLFDSLYRLGLSQLFHKMLPFIFWENGPIILPPINEPSQREAICQEILNEIVTEAQRRNCYEIKSARPPYFDDQSKAFTSTGFTKRKMGTVLVNVEEPLEIVWKRIERDCRRTIRRGVEQGIDVTRASKLEELREFYDLNIQLCRRSGIKIYPFSHFISLWNHFVPLNKIVVFIARVRDQAVGGLLCLMHNETIHAFRIGDSDYARNNKIYALYPLFWHIIKWAHENEFRYFDIMGVESYKIEAGHSKARDIYRFKRKWGQFVEFNDYEKQLQDRNLADLLDLFLVDSL